MLEPGRVRVFDGPKENLARPAINPLFRSAAAAYGSRVIGVMLTGLLDDGVAGLAEIKRRGGIAVVQNPATALYPSMPANAVRYVDVDHVIDLKDVPGVLTVLAESERSGSEKAEPMNRNLIEMTCPECRGPIWEERQGKIVEYRCRVGHAYSPLSLAEEHHGTVERAVWATIVALEEAADIQEKLAPELGDKAAHEAKVKREQIATLKELLAAHKSD
jgi:two-component system chemotaxis response regulator CheB